MTGNETLVCLETTMGNIIVKLYDETPKHRDNFIKLVKEGVYDSTLFHRVIKNFMIQAGDPQSKTATDTTTTLGTGDVGYTIPAEINPKFFHKRGVLAAARQGDEEREKIFWAAERRPEHIGRNGGKGLRGSLFLGWS